MSVSGSAEPGKRDANRRRIEHRQVALHVDDGVVGAIGVELRDRRLDAVGAGRQLRIGHHRAPAGRFDRIGDRPVAAGDDDRAELGGDGAAPDMNDHRHPADVGERLAGQPRRGEPGGDQDDRVVVARLWSREVFAADRAATTCPVRAIAGSAII